MLLLAPRNFSLIFSPSPTREPRTARLLHRHLLLADPALRRQPSRTAGLHRPDEHCLRLDLPATRRLSSISATRDPAPPTSSSASESRSSSAACLDPTDSSPLRRLPTPGKLCHSSSHSELYSRSTTSQVQFPLPAPCSRSATSQFYLPLPAPHSRSAASHLQPTQLLLLACRLFLHPTSLQLLCLKLCRATSPSPLPPDSG